MKMAFSERPNSLYGFETPISPAAQIPIISLRVPTITDFTSIGRIWVDKPNDTAYILTSIVANVATWVAIGSAAGAGVFNSLTVNPGPVSITGATVVNNSGAANTAIGTGTNTGVLAMGNTVNGGTSIEGSNIVMDSAAAGTIFVGTQLLAANVSVLSGINTGAQVVGIFNGNSAGNQTFNLLNGTPTAGNQTVNIVGANNTRGALINIGTGAAGHIVTIGSTDTTASTVINGGVLGGILLGAGGTVLVDAAAVTVASPTAIVLNDFNVGACTFTGFTTASAANQVFIITNTTATITSQIFVTACNEGAADAQMTVTRVDRKAGSFEVTLTNFGAAALNGNITINFWKISA